MKSKMTTNSQLSTNKPKRKENNHNRKESEKWTSHRGSSVGRRKGEIEGKMYRE